MEKGSEDPTRLEEWIDDFHTRSTPTPACSFTISAPSSIDEIGSGYEDEEKSSTSSWKLNEPIQDIEIPAGNGTIFIEGQLKDDLSSSDIDQMQEDLQLRLFDVNFSFQIDEDLLVDADNTPVYLGTQYKWCKSFLESLKVVEYSAATRKAKYYSVNGRSTRFDVRLYYLIPDEPKSGDNSFMPQAEVMYLPNAALQGIWESLIFNDGHKYNLVWKVTNMIQSIQRSTVVNIPRDRIVLLYGRSGTGKSSLCQSVAQKLSIRLSSRYTKTKMIQLKTATLLSKYFSESAKIVDDICTTLAGLCIDEPTEFNCVLIDEVESLTMSRQRGCQNGESQDTLRAANALLTGLDRLKAFPNIIFLCTSNMPELMDSAFLNRCSLQIAIEPPTMASRYAIIRGELQRLVDIGIISYSGQIPVLLEASQESNAGIDGPGTRLLNIVKHIGRIVAASPDRRENSARFLSQFPQEAIELYLREECCSLQMAYLFMERFLKINDIQLPAVDGFHNGTLACKEDDAYTNDRAKSSSIAMMVVWTKNCTGKRTIRLSAEGDEEQVFDDLSTYLQGRHKKAKLSHSEQTNSPTSDTHDEFGSTQKKSNDDAIEIQSNSPAGVVHPE